MVEFSSLLVRELAGTGVTVGEATLVRLEALDRLVARWDRVARLTGFADRETRARRYHAEALGAVRWLPERGVALDVGSGGGSPALPLAVMRPGLSWTLVEPNAKKATFLEEASRELDLDVRVLRARAEELASVGGDVVTLRGVKLTAGISAWIVSSLSRQGRFLWFGSEALLREGQKDFERKGFVPVGPKPLLPGTEGEGRRGVRPGGWLLVVGRTIRE